MTMKTDIDYATFKKNYVDPKGKNKEVILYNFWPNGVWDDNHYTLEEAQAAYPKERYNWKKARV